MHEVTPAEQKQFSLWAWGARARTTFDVDIIGHPRAAMLITEDEQGPTSYLPVQTVLMAEVFIPRPEMSNRHIALSIGRLDSALVELGKSLNIADVYCYVPGSEIDYAVKIQRHGWVEVPNVHLFKKAAIQRVTQ